MDCIPGFGMVVIGGVAAGEIPFGRRLRRAVRGHRTGYESCRRDACCYHPDVFHAVSK